MWTHFLSKDIVKRCRDTSYFQETYFFLRRRYKDTRFKDLMWDGGYSDKWYPRDFTMVGYFIIELIEALIENEDGVELPDNMGTIQVVMVNNESLAGHITEGFNMGYTPVCVWLPYTAQKRKIKIANDVVFLYGFMVNPLLDAKLRAAYKKDKLWHLYQYDNLEELSRTYDIEDEYYKASRIKT